MYNMCFDECVLLEALRLSIIISNIELDLDNRIH